MLRIRDFIKEWPVIFPANTQPWEFTTSLSDLIVHLIPTLDADYIVDKGIAIHKTAIVEEAVILKAPIIIGPNCFIAAHAYLRGGVYLGDAVTIGPGCEIKSSILLSHSSTAHFNFIGDSIIGSYVNFEAGAVIANHYNEKADKKINVYHDGKVIATNTEKFGALIGDHCKVGANAVLSPGTVLAPHSIVKRLELVDQSIT
ncbi:MAG: LpxA family transferase [Bacteroidetes bacterium]|nr:LpxA family transferase [Bacteroidota bacterium]